MRVPTRSIVLAGSMIVLAGCSEGTSIPTGLAAPRQANEQGPEAGKSNLEVILRGDGFGLVKFRQPKDDAFIIYLDTKLRGLEPNTDYVLQREADPNLDGICNSTSTPQWLTLGKGLDPQTQTITTDDKGTGEASLFRDVKGALATAATYDIAFRVVNVATQAVVLTSDCYRYTISE